MANPSIQAGETGATWQGPTPLPRLVRIMLPLLAILVAFRLALWGLHELILDDGANDISGAVLELVAYVVFFRAAMFSATSGRSPIEDDLATGYLTIMLIMVSHLVFAVLGAWFIDTFYDLNTLPAVLLHLAYGIMVLSGMVAIAAPWLLREIVQSVLLSAGPFWPRLGYALAFGLFISVLGLLPAVFLLTLGSVFEWAAAAWLTASYGLLLVLLAWVAAKGAQPEVEVSR